MSIEKIEEYWSKLPNNLVWTYTDGEECLCKDNNKLLPTIVYLDTHYNPIMDTTYFTISDLITSCGSVVKNGKGKSVEQFKDQLKILQSYKWLDNTIDIDNLKINEMVQCKFNITYKQKDNNDTEWFKLQYDNYKKIMNCDTKIDKFITLKIYCHIISRMKKNADGKLDTAEKYMCYDNVTVECCYDTYENICANCGVDGNKGRFKKYLDLLEQLELIYNDNIGTVTINNKTHTASNCYTETAEELERALDCSVKFYEDNGYIINNEKVQAVIRRLNGLKGRKKQLKEKGKDTSEIDKKIDKIIKPKEEEQEETKNTRTGFNATNKAIEGTSMGMNKFIDKSKKADTKAKKVNTKTNKRKWYSDEVEEPISSSLEDIIWGGINPFEQDNYTYKEANEWDEVDGLI